MKAKNKVSAVVTAKVDRDPAKVDEHHLDFDEDRMVLDDGMEVNEDANTDTHSKKHVPIVSLLPRACHFTTVDEEDIPKRVLRRAKTVRCCPWLLVPTTHLPNLTKMWYVCHQKII
jgi:hypothetical protein